jgi:hypothetical protein
MLSSRPTQQRLSAITCVLKVTLRPTLITAGYCRVRTAHSLSLVARRGPSAYLDEGLLMGSACYDLAAGEMWAPTVRLCRSDKNQRRKRSLSVEKTRLQARKPVAFEGACTVARSPIASRDASFLAGSLREKWDSAIGAKDRPEPAPSPAHRLPRLTSSAEYPSGTPRRSSARSRIPECRHRPSAPQAARASGLRQSGEY